MRFTKKLVHFEGSAATAALSAFSVFLVVKGCAPVTHVHAMLHARCVVLAAGKPTHARTLPVLSIPSVRANKGYHAPMCTHTGSSAALTFWDGARPSASQAPGSQPTSAVSGAKP